MTYLTLALVGDPNCGKTTLFNALTGSEQRIGNWPGVTVEKKEGQFSVDDRRFSVIDLPGTYTLDTEMSDGLDERIALDYINSMKDGLLINVVDASNLERHLYLTVQLLERGIPMIVVLTMNDRLPKDALNIKELELVLGVPVVAVMAHKQQQLDALYDALKQALPTNVPLKIDIGSTLHDASEDVDILIADARYGFAQQACQKAFEFKAKVTDRYTQVIDKWVLNRFLGLPIFLLMMYTMFLFSINIGGVFQDFFDQTSQLILVDGVAHVLSALHTPDVFTALLAFGLGKGINTLLTFVPVITSLFFFLSLLEGSGYMARAAFVVDRIMRSIGLPGKAFVPLIVGFGCNVPSIMATRTLDSEKDRIMAAMMSPFMSCSARLAIFTVFVSVFFPVGGHNIIFALYMIGICIAILTGFFLRNTLLNKDLSPLLMELPPYHLPNIKGLFHQTWSRLRHFLVRAGRIIVPVCSVLGVLNALSVNEHGFMLNGSGDSVLAWLGKWLTPLFKPMGLRADNWPATVGLLMGTLAKEVVIATLNTLYSGMAGLSHAGTESYDFWQGLHQALLTIPEKIGLLSHAFYHPILASAPDQSLNDGVKHVLYQHFDGLASVFAYLLFILLYVPCVSTMAAIRKELNAFWMYFSIIWSTGIAYMSAVLSYQLLTISQHYAQSIAYIGLFLAIFFVMRYVVKGKMVLPLMHSMQGASN